jgi:hypothetical protein
LDTEKMPSLVGRPLRRFSTTLRSRRQLCMRCRQ